MTTEIAPAKASSAPPPAFQQALGRFHFEWRSGLLLAGFLRALGWFGAAFLLAGAFDYYAGFSDPVRRVVGSLLALAGGVGGVSALWDTLLFNRREAAAAADQALRGGRREILSALELAAEPQTGGPLRRWLRARAIQSAAHRLGALPTSLSWPLRRLAREAIPLAAVASLAAVTVILAPDPSGVIARRLLFPHADIPPWSRLLFALTPARAEVLYGGEIQITAEITGDKVDAAVHCLIRDPISREIEDLPAFRETETRFSRKLEKVASPVEVAFSVGRIRSGWKTVAVRLQPKIREIVLTVQPPAYSRLPRREFAAGSQPLSALPASRVSARVASNRPLSGGTLRIYEGGAAVPAQEIAAEREDLHHVRFTWLLRNAARLSLEVRDTLNTASEPAQFDQKVTPDERPEVSLREPAGDVLATPDSEMPLEFSASDDLGLTRVSLVRRLQGYRERSLQEPLESGSRRFDLGDKLRLAPFGVAPGQTIELTVEAADTNPTLMGVTVSEPARIHIITAEQYAQILRNQVTLEEFSARYAALQEAFEEARKSLDALQKAAESGDPAKTEEARKQALAAHEKAAEIFGSITKDFPLFDLDRSLSAATGQAMEELFQNGKQLEELWRAQPPEVLKALPQLRERLGQSEEQMAGEMKKGERAAAASKIFEEAGRFNEIIQAQRDLVKDFNWLLEQLHRGEMQAGQGLRDLAKRQRDIAAQLRDLDSSLAGATQDLPEEFSKLKEETTKFLDALHEFDIPPTMDEGSHAGETGDSKIGGDRAGEALAKLEALLRRPNGICEMCRGEGVHFPWPEDLSKTLEQMMQALIPKPGSKSGSGQGRLGEEGGGSAGSSDSGYWMKGKMPRVPVFGPSRMRIASRGASGLRQGQGAPGEGGAERPDVGASRVSPSENRKTSGEAFAPEAIPERYRDAVKRYFSAPEESPAPPPPTSSQPTKP